MESNPRKPLWSSLEIQNVTQHPSPLLDAIDQIGPGEVVALWREAAARLTEADANEEIEDAEVTRLEDFAIDLDIALWQLPQYNLAHARAVYAAFAESPLDCDRRQGAVIVYTMPRVDRNYGLRLWNQLMRDRSADVRLQAKEALYFYLKEDEYAEEGLSCLGITWRDAYRLLDAYANAERGFSVYELGAAVLQEATESRKERPQ